MFDDQPIDSNVKRYKEIRKSTTSLSAGKKSMTNQLILMKKHTKKSEQQQQHKAKIILQDVCWIMIT